MAIDLYVFDKDGTLIDFHAMWSGWARAIGRALDVAADATVTPRLARLWGFDPDAGTVDPRGALATAPMAELRALAGQAVAAAGRPDATALVAAIWRPPDPVALARPLADLPALFGALRAAGAKIAVATTDDRAPTVATLAALGLAPLVDALGCGDDGLPLKPAPDVFLAICRGLGVPPARAAMVGDTLADMRMGRAAGAGRVIGVLSGAGTAELLGPLADMLIPSVAALRPGVP
jgi:phosphoglycolate phosphatase